MIRNRAHNTPPSFFSKQHYYYCLPPHENKQVSRGYEENVHSTGSTKEKSVARLPFVLAISALATRSRLGRVSATRPSKITTIATGIYSPFVPGSITTSMENKLVFGPSRGPTGYDLHNQVHGFFWSIVFSELKRCDDVDSRVVALELRVRCFRQTRCAGEPVKRAIA